MHAPVLMLAALSTLFACGGGPQQPATPPPAPAEPAPPSLEEQYPRLICPEGSTYAISETAQGVEQICEAGGTLEGPFARWADRIKLVEGAYHRGQPDGNWIWKAPDGAKKSKGAYKNGKETGTWTWWHPNGERAEEGDFLDGRKVGYWTLWYTSTKIQEEGLYHNGQKSGDWSYRRDDEGNSAYRKETWKTGQLAETKYFDAEGKETDEVQDGNGAAADAAQDG